MGDGGSDGLSLRPRARAADTEPDEASRTSSASRNRELLALGAVLLAATSLRLPFLGQASLWLDEMWSIATSRLPWRSILTVVLHQDSNASLYYALLHAWMSLGQGETWVRLLSVAAGVATVPAVYALGKRLAGARVGIVAGALLAVNGYHVQFSQEARAYSLVVLLVTLSTLLFVKSTEERTARSWCGYVLTSALAVHAHVFAVLALASQWASLALLPRRSVPWKRTLAAAAAIGTLVLPVAFLLQARMREPEAPLGWATRPTVRRVGTLFWLLSGNSDYASPTLPDALRGAPLLATYFVICLAALAGAARAWRTSGRTLQGWRRGLPYFWLFAPIASSLAVSFVKPVFVPKYLLVCMPGLVLLAAMGIDSMKVRWARVAAVLGLVVLSAGALARYYGARSRSHGWQAVTGHILGEVRAGDAVIFFVAPGRLLFDHYRASSGAGTDVNIVFPLFESGTESPDILRYLPPMRSDLLDAAMGGERVWLVLFHDEYRRTSAVSRWMRDSLAASWRQVQEQRFPGCYESVAVLLYERPR